MFALQNFFWAVAVGTHLAQGEIVRPTPSLLLTLVGTALLVRPSSVPLLLCVIAGQLLDVALHLPVVADHWALLAVAGLWLLLGTGLLALKNRRLPSAAEVYALHAPGLCLLLLVGYLFVTLAKIDAGFPDPRLACSATILLEGGILLLLCLRRTRVLGLVIGCVFHIALGVGGAYDFAAVILALYVPLLGEDFAPRLRAVLARVPSAQRAFALWLRFAHARATLPVLLLLALALAFVPGLLGLDPRMTERVATSTYRLLWMDPAGLLLTMILAVWWFERAGLTYSVRIALGHPLALVPLALITLLGLRSYLGLQTAGQDPIEITPARGACTR